MAKVKTVKKTTELSWGFGQVQRHDAFGLWKITLPPHLNINILSFDLFRNFVLGTIHRLFWLFWQGV